MKFLKSFLKKSLICCSLLNTAIYAESSFIKDISAQLETHPVFPTNPFKLIEEKNIFFKENPELLSKLDIQMSVQLLTPKKYKDLHDIFEIDGFAKALNEDDKVIVAKMVAVLKNVSPEFFTASRMSTPEYLSRSISDADCEVVDKERCIVRQSKKLPIIDAWANVHYSSFNFETDEGQEMDRGEAEDLRNIFSNNDDPVVVASAKAGPSDVGDGTYGFRMVNFYYPLNEKDTLLVTYKIFTLKKEWLFKGPIWTRVQKDAVKNLISGTKKSIEKLREYYLEQYSLSTHKDL